MSTLAPIRVAMLRNSASRLTELAQHIATEAPEVTLTRVASSWDELVVDGEIPAEILLLDRELDDSGTSIADLTRRVRALGARVITLTSRDDPKAVMTDMAAGADAALRSTDSPRRVVQQVLLAVHRAHLIRARGASRS